MPVFAVNLQGDVWARQEKVNAVSAHTRLLDVFDFEGIKNVAHGLFKRSLTLKAAVAGKRAELAVGVAGLSTEGLPTSATFDNMGWAPTFLRAVMDSESRRSKRVSRTVRRFGIFGTCADIHGYRRCSDQRCYEGQRTLCHKRGRVWSRTNERRDILYYNTFALV
jgi:hypothetical protein